MSIVANSGTQGPSGAQDQPLLRLAQGLPGLGALSPPLLAPPGPLLQTIGPPAGTHAAPGLRMFLLLVLFISKGSPGLVTATADLGPDLGFPRLIAVSLPL